MCGIAGLFDLSRGQPAGALDRAVRNMIDTLDHRGPDGQGTFVDEAGGVALGHRRLAVIDLSDAGAQPMTSANGRFVIAFNGEIYNFAEIARALPQSTSALRGHSDTEVLLESCARFGIDGTLGRSVGMFAVALWDKRERILTLARDRLGIKPLYWARAGRMILFASEIKAILAHPAFEPEIDRDALAAYLRSGYVPTPRSIYRNLFKLRPGTVLRLTSTDAPMKAALGTAPDRGRKHAGPADHRPRSRRHRTGGPPDRRRARPAGIRRAARRFPFRRHRSRPPSSP